MIGEIILNYDEIALAIMREDRHNHKWTALLDEVARQAPKIHQAEEENRLEERWGGILNHGTKIIRSMLHMNLGDIALFAYDTMHYLNIGSVDMRLLYLALDNHLSEGHLDSVISVLEDAFDFAYELADYIADPENGPINDDPLPIMETMPYREARTVADKFAYSHDVFVALTSVPAVRATIIADELTNDALEDLVVDVWAALREMKYPPAAGRAA